MAPDPTACDRCERRRPLYYNEATSLSLCSPCDTAADAEAAAHAYIANLEARIEESRRISEYLSSLLPDGHPLKGA